MSTDPGYYYQNGKFSRGIVGFQGTTDNLGVVDTTPKETLSKETYGFIIETSDDNLYNQIKESLDKSETSENWMQQSIPRKELYRTRKMKAVHIEEYDKIIKKEKEINSKCENMINELRGMGCYIEDIMYPYSSIPRDWYEDGEIIYSKNKIEITCNNDSEIYNDLKSNGIFDKNMPEKKMKKEFTEGDHYLNIITNEMYIYKDGKWTNS